jgi:hypothetical protein
MEQQLLERIAADPDVAGNWRLLGHMRLSRGDVSAALAACQKAVELDPTGASSQFDLAQAFRAAGESSAAAEHFQAAYEAAPQSDYGIEAARCLRQLGREPLPPLNEPAAADARAGRFGGVDSEPSPKSDFALSGLIEFGTLYNSNVQLAPISRIISEPGLGSSQGFVVPDLRWTPLDSQTWRAGTRLRGNFNVNESGLSQFNLQEYQPGFFAERSLFIEEFEYVARVQYDFALDQFSGKTFATRHSLVAAIDQIAATTESTLYWAIDDTNYNDDGLDPTIESLDGWTHTVGMSQTWYPDSRWFDLVRWGGDLQWAPLEGRDFGYRGAFAYVESETPAYCDSTLGLQFGLGFRAYPEFTSFPSRDETLYRARIQWRKWLSEQWELIGFASYDRFACDHQQFDTYRFLGGVSVVFEF